MSSLDTLSNFVMPFHPPPVMTSTIACKPVQQPSRSATFAILPEELVVKILECCDFKGVLACQLVRACSSFIDANDDLSTIHHLVPSPAVTRRRAILSEMSSWVRQAFAINSRSPNTECAMAL